MPQRGLRPRCGSLLTIAATACLLQAAVAAAFRNEPAGFGGVHLGASVDDAKQALPNLEQVGAAPPGELATYRLAGQEFAGLQPCALLFSFFQKRLYEIQFDCGHDPKVQDALVQTFGWPSRRESYGIFWYGEHMNLSLSPGSMAFGMSDPVLLGAAQSAILRRVAEQKAKAAGGASK